MDEEETKKDETKKDEQKEKEVVPKWVQKLEQSMNKLTEKLDETEESPKELAIQVPVPPVPEIPEEQEEAPQEEAPQEQETKKKRSFLDWLL